MTGASDPICALITPGGYAAIAMLRISGKGAIELTARHFRPATKLLEARSHSIVHGYFTDAEGRDIDEVLAYIFRKPHSYTGEDLVELSCHGNPDLAKRILQTLLISCRPANPGEFTLRAYLNGKLDLNQAEAVNDLIHAKAHRAEKAALMQLQGQLSKTLQQLLESILHLRMRCELAIDFSDQDLPLPENQELRHELEQVLEAAKALAATGNQGKLIREGIKICLSGAPNAGKSSLFNAFLKQNRALVTPHPGTTRDYLEESISLNGFPVIFYDTAGLRDDPDSIEAQGIAKSLELMHSADLILYLIDATLPDNHALPDLEPELLHKTLFVYSKMDLLPAGKNIPQAAIPCSALLPDGLKQASEAILHHLMLHDLSPDEPLVTNARQLSALHKSIAFLDEALLAHSENRGYEFIAFELGSAGAALEEILGIISSDDLLGEIFSNFCIGK